MNFRTLTDEQIIKMAYDHILMKNDTERMRKARLTEEGGKAPTAEHWMRVYEEQMKELEAYLA